jgi:hypothetical protein
MADRGERGAWEHVVAKRAARLGQTLAGSAALIAMMRRVCPLILLLAAAWPARANAEKIRVSIVGAVGSGIPHAGPVEALAGQEVRLYALVRMGRGRRTRYFADAPQIRLGRRRIGGRRLRPLSELGPHALFWARIEPRPHHVALDPPNPGNPAYSNSVLFGSKHGRWLGYDTIEYEETPIEGAVSPTLSLARVEPTDPKVDINAGLGTMRYRVYLQLGGQLYASVGSDARTRGGIAPSVMRVSYRAGNDLVGQLASYFNVPNVFGSAGKGRRHQTELFQGADCADVIVGAARRAGARLPYSSVAGLLRHTQRLSGKLLLQHDGLFEIADEMPAGAKHLSFGNDIRRGDLMLIDYAGFDGSPRSWDHIAVIAEDRGVVGQFDPEDIVLHMGYLYGLTREQASSQSPAIIQFVRFNGQRRWANRHQRDRRAELIAERPES